ncbi:MAG: hypothetical protein R3321_11305 [Nitrososphaeraceae archaeon]|nr:hypothetical protein [Nitrososphaeraceae archaeon]
MAIEPDKEKYFNYVHESIKNDQMPLDFDAWKIQYREIEVCFEIFVKIAFINKERFMQDLEQLAKRYTNNDMKKYSLKNLGE